MFHFENGHIKMTNPIVWRLKYLKWVLIIMCATQLKPNRPKYYFTATPVRARQHQIRAPQKRILEGLSRGPYPYRVTVYPYNGYIRSTNPIVRHAMSLTWSPTRQMCKSMHSETCQNTTFTLQDAHAPHLWLWLWQVTNLYAQDGTKYKIKAIPPKGSLN